MNEQLIKELAREAGLIAPYGSDRVGLRDFDYREFAELLIWECINVVEKRFMGDMNREDLEVRRCVQDLKQYFGVEE